MPTSSAQSLTSSTTNDPGSPSDAQAAVHSTRFKESLATSSPNSPTANSHTLSSVTPRTPTAGNTATSSMSEKSTSIEQSVRTFRIFEVLRGGNTAAISKVIRDISSTGGDYDASSDTTVAAPLAGTSILHLAIQCAEVPVVEFVLSLTDINDGRGTDVNARDRDGNTPLHVAAMLGRTLVVEMLLDRAETDDTLTNYQGRSPLDLARTPEIFQQLQLSRSLFFDAKVKEVRDLVQKEDLEALEALLMEPRIQAVLDINGTELTADANTNESGGTLLHEAARKRDIRLIEILLLNGADPFRRDRKGKLPQDVTKDDKTRAVLKRSPAAAAAQRGIQEKAVLGNAASQAMALTGSGDNALAGKEGREMKGYLKKWTNYTSGYKLRFFVLEDGVLSYYKHQDDAGSACRGAINMRIAKLHMDPQDKQKFEIQGKSSVKYHLKANHVVEAKRWVWALTNAIQWTKDEAKDEEKKKARETETMKHARMEQVEKVQKKDKDWSDAPADSSSVHSGKMANRTSKHLIPASSAGPMGSRVSLGAASVSPGSVGEEEDVTGYELGTNVDVDRAASHMGATTIDGDLDDEEEYGDDASAREIQPTSKDAFSITAQSAKLQLDLLAQVSGAIQVEQNRQPETTISSPDIVQAVASYESAVRSLRALLGDLLKISRDRDAFWQYRLDREADVRRLWEDSMARVAKEQEILEGRIGESESRRKRTKRALRDALENASDSGVGTRLASPGIHEPVSKALEKVELDEGGNASFPGISSGLTPRRRKSTMVEAANLADSDSDQDEEFFDAIDAGEVEVIGEMPVASKSPPASGKDTTTLQRTTREAKAEAIRPSFAGYEEPVRKRLKLDADDRPKISLWGILKSMIGKDMTKMTLPVSFNEPTSLLQRVAEDMEYTDLLDTAADRDDSAERMVYVATFAASEYASTIGRVAKPFNPLLGETYEYVRPDKGYRFFVEQVSHHPPVGAAFAESPKWDYFGESAVKSKFYGKSFEFNPLGTWFLRLRPSSGAEELYTWKKVTSSVVGIITNNPTVDNYGPMEVKNWTTGEVCMLDFKQRGWRAAGAYQVQGKVLNKDHNTMWSIGGHWNDKIYARPGYEAPASPGRGEGAPAQAFLVWKAHSRPAGVPFNLTTFCLTLNAMPDSLRPHLPPTDTRLRPDQRAMEDGEYEFAATEKNRVEEKQRAKRRERESLGEEFTPRWFRKGKSETTGEEYWVFNGEYWKTRHEVSKGGSWKDVEDIF
ncbi:MAG: hypothetical protein M1833_006985 [Piccolia ochrophora]|nr:MAG: hypothetical protein M1833_006985 [Piccolia ochrophora]